MKTVGYPKFLEGSEKMKVNPERYEVKTGIIRGPYEKKNR